MTGIAIALFILLQASIFSYNEVMDRSACEIDVYSSDCAVPRQHIEEVID